MAQPKQGPSILARFGKELGDKLPALILAGAAAVIKVQVRVQYIEKDIEKLEKKFVVLEGEANAKRWAELEKKIEALEESTTLKKIESIEEHTKDIQTLKKWAECRDKEYDDPEKRYRFYWQTLECVAYPKQPGPGNQPPSPPPA